MLERDVVDRAAARLVVDQVVAGLPDQLQQWRQGVLAAAAAVSLRVRR